MSVKTIGVLGNLSPDTERGPSPSIWNANGSNNGWMADYIQNPRLGVIFWEDFIASGVTPGTGSAATYSADKNWYAYATTGGVITDAGIVGGGVQLYGATTAHQGVALGELTNTFQLITSGGAMQGRLYFECRVNLSAAALAQNTCDMFIGLIDTTTTTAGLPAAGAPITSTNGTLTASGLIGFHQSSVNTATYGADWDFVYQKAAGTETHAANLRNIVTTVTGTAPVGGTFYKLGFVFNPFAETQLIGTASTGQTAGTLARPIVQVYVNGQPAAAFLTSTNVAGTAFPITSMAPAIAFLQQSTTSAVNAQIDWIACIQEMIA